MVIDRRRFLAWVSAWGLAPGMAAAGTEAPHGDAALYLAARKGDYGFEAALIDDRGSDQLVIPLPHRGHSFAIDRPRQRAVAFGRQPGFFAIAFDISGREPPTTVLPAAERHFFGHGVFSRDGKLLYATENDYASGVGVIGIYDASAGGGYRRLGEFPTFGVGPHEVVLMPDGRTLAVANGGILTHPDYGKLQLNVDAMQPSLVYIDSGSGQLLEKLVLDPALNRLSIRHLVTDKAGALWFGCQHTGPASERPPLVGRHRRGEEPQLFSGSSATLRSMENYVGSLAADATGTTIATTSPVGGLVVFWDARTGGCQGSTPVFDGCGVAGHGQQAFLITNGQGRLFVADSRGSEPVEGRAALAWDNHLRRL